MTATDIEHWKRLDALLQQALDLPAAEREAWLARHDAATQQQLRALLARAADSGFMDRPVAAATVDAAVEDAHGDRAGDRVGPYVLRAPLGSGGMGTVWSAEPVEGPVRRTVALKLPRAGWSPGLAERLKRESELLSRLEHPGIARLYDAGLTGNGRPYLAMEAIDGLPIDRFASERELPIRGRLELFLQVAQAISYAHARLVVHRDLKPSNILVDAAGRAHVVDFGLATLLDATRGEQSQLTQTLARMLTPEYASPEQVRGEPVTVASDVYSLGVVLYEMLSGQRPYRVTRGSAAALEEAIAAGDLAPASSRAERRAARVLRGDLDTILAKALKRAPAERYASMDAFAADVERYLKGERVLARPDTFFYSAGKFVRRHRVAVVASGVVAASIVAGLAGTIHQAREAEAQAAQARLERDRSMRELRFAEGSEELARILLTEQAEQPLAAGELLRRAQDRVREQFAGEPLLRARLQLMLADLYGELTDFGAAQKVLGEAKVSAELGGDGETLRQVECTRAAVLAVRGQPKEAMAVFDAVMGTPEFLRDADSRDAHVCYSQRSLVHRNLGNPAASVKDAEAALRIPASARPANRLNRIFLRTTIADAMSAKGQLAEAVAVYEEAWEELGRIGRQNTPAGSIARNNIVVMHTRAGQLRRAADFYAHTADMPGRPTDSSAVINYARVLADIGRPDEATALLEGAIVEKRRLGDRRGEAFGLLTLAGAACARGDAAGCERALDEAEPKLKAVLPPGHSSGASVELWRGRARVARGDLDGAHPHFERAVALYEAAPDRNNAMIRALSDLAVSRQQRGDAAGAIAAASRAVELAKGASRGFPATEWLGSALLAQAMVHRQQGDLAAARTAAAEARRHLFESVGEAAPQSRRADALVRGTGG